jgi:hypothetical protein
MKKTFLLLPLLFISGNIHSYAQEQLPPIAEREYTYLEKKIDTLQSQLNAEKESREAMKNTLSYSIIGIIVGFALTLFGYLAFPKFVNSRIRMEAVTIIDRNLPQEIEKRLPPYFAKEFQANVSNYMIEQAAFLMEIIGDHAQIETFRNTKKVIVFYENEADKKESLDFLHVKHRFAHIVPRQPKKGIDISNYDLVIFNCMTCEVDNNEHLTREYMQSMIQAHKNRMFLYLGKHDKIVISEAKQLGAANFWFTALYRIIEMLRYADHKTIA